MALRRILYGQDSGPNESFGLQDSQPILTTTPRASNIRNSWLGKVSIEICNCCKALNEVVLVTKLCNCEYVKNKCHCEYVNNKCPANLRASELASQQPVR